MALCFAHHLHLLTCAWHVLAATVGLQEWLLVNLLRLWKPNPTHGLSQQKSALALLRPLAIAGLRS